MTYRGANHFRMLVAIAAAASIIFYPLPLPAEEPPVMIEIHYMPPGRLMFLPESGLEFMCFNIDEYKFLLMMDNELHTVSRQFELLSNAEIDYQNILVKKEEVIGTLESDKALLAKRCLRLEGQWQTCEEELIEASSGSVWPYILAATGAVIGIAGVIWGATVQVTSSR